MPARYGDLANGEMPDQIYGVSWNGDEKVNYTYDSLGRLTNKVVGGNIPQPLNTTYSYVDVHDTKTTTLLSSMTTEWITHSYTYDELGNITAIGLNEENINSYEYDYLNQLVRANEKPQNKTFTYEYINGNIKYVHEYDYTTGTLPETPLKTTEYHYDDEVWSDVLTGVSQYSYNTSNVSTYARVGDDAHIVPSSENTSIEEYARSILGDDLGDYEIVDFGSKALLSPQSESSGVSTYSLPRSTNLDFTYSVESDEIGNITNIDGIQIEWNGRRAVGVQKGNNTITYEYNIDGQRVSKTVNGVKTEYFYNGDILAGQKTGNDTVIFMYDNNGDIFGFNYNGEEYYYVKNAQNDVVLILNGDRTAAVIYMYDAWGNITGALDLSVDRISNINPITYRSYYYDIEMGVYYLNSRYYAPVICRFMSADGYVQTGQGMLDKNMFAYCQNNPVNMSDEDGNWPKWLTGTLNIVSGTLQMLAGAALGATCSWTGIGAAAAGVLIINGAATVAQGVGQIVNDVSNTTFMREDNIVKTSVQDIGQTIAGDTGRDVAGYVYDGVVVAASVYAGAIALKEIVSQSMPQIINSKLFSINDGYGFKIGKYIEMLYRNPNAAGGMGGTFFSYKGPWGNFRIDWDPAHGFHTHPPGH